jgi:hypothetical protein
MWFLQTALHGIWSGERHGKTHPAADGNAEQSSIKPAEMGKSADIKNHGWEVEVRPGLNLKLASCGRLR